MAIYAIGDIQGCYDPFRRLLDKIKFDPAEDQLWLTGDLVNRGVNSLQTLRYVKSLGKAVISVLGNHDLHLLTLHYELKPMDKGSLTLRNVLDAHDRDSLMEWLRRRPLIHYQKLNNRMLVHAGIYPRWSIQESIAYACEIEKYLRGPKCKDLLSQMYGDDPISWSNELSEIERYRFIINAFTRMRFLGTDNTLDFDSKGTINNHKGYLSPWFDQLNKQWINTTIIFGHWSALGLMIKPNVICLDTGYVWGGELTAINLDNTSTIVRVSQIK